MLSLLLTSLTSVAAFAAWVTVMVCEVNPAAEIVIIAFRTLVFGFAVAVKVMVELLEPAELFTVSQVSLMPTVHNVFEKISKVEVLLAVAMLRVLGETAKVAEPAAWVTVMVFATKPVVETFMVALRSEVVGLASSVNVTVPLPEPDEGLNVNHESAAELAVVQEALE